MQKESIISKGKYSFPQAENIVSVKQYFFVRDEKGQKRLLLRFFNDRDELCTKFAFVIRFMDSRGKVIDEESFETANVSIKGKSSYSFDEAIFVNERCTTFKVEVLYASYGDYKYVNDNNIVNVEYSKATIPVASRTPKHTNAPRKIRARSFKMPWIYMALSLVILAVAILVMCIHLRNFVETEDEFTLSGVEYEFIDKKKEKVIITGYTGSYTNILIPSNIEGYEVVGIENGAFKNNDKIKKVRIEGVDIGEDAFKGCSNLTEVEIDSVALISENAFYNCKKLNKLTITSTHNDNLVDEEEPVILSIDRNAFANCTALTTVKIDQLTSYENNSRIFENDYSISELYLKNFAYDLGDDVAQETRLTDLVSHDNYYYAQPLPLKKLSIGYIDKIPNEFCKDYTTLETFEITESPVSTVGKNAFNGCVSLRSVSFKDPIRVIESGAFANTKITSFDAREVASVGNDAFYGCSELKSFNLGGNNTIKTIGDSAFERCTALESIVLPNTLTNLGECAFAYNTSLTVFKYANSDLEIEQGILVGCKAIKELDLAELPGDYVGYLFLDPDDNVRNYTDEQLAKKYSSIISPNLVKITLSGSATELKKLAFAGCKNLQALSLPKGIVSIEDYAFADCQKLVDINLGDTVESIGKYAFMNTGITAFVLPKAMTEVSRGMFLDCKNLESITLHENVTAIGEEAFKNCEKLSKADLFEVKSIDDYAFANTGLEKIVVPADVEYVGIAIFKDCNSLKEITAPLTDGIFKSDTIAKIINYFTEYGIGYNDVSSGIIKVTVNAGYIIDYDSFVDLTGVKEIVLENGIEHINSNAFSGLNELRRLILPETLMSFSYDAASNAYRLYEICNPSAVDLSTVNLPYTLEITTSKDALPRVITDGYEFACYNEIWYLVNWDNEKTKLTPPSSFTYQVLDGDNSVAFAEYVDKWSIAPSLFRETYGVESIALPSSVQSIGDYAFRNCGVKEITFAKNAPITEISDLCFYECSSLAKITLPNSVTKIGENAFSYCVNLKEISLPESLVEIESYAFANCIALECITLESQLEAIDDTSFYGCNSIYDVYNLSSLGIVEGSTSYSGIARRAFVHTSRASSRSVKVNVSGIGTIRYCGSEWIILSFDDYATELDTTKFRYNGLTPTQIRILEGVYNPDYNNYSLKKLVIGDNVTQIHKSAFENCVSLTDADFSANTRITTIEKSTFENCRNLLAVSLPQNLISIEARAFYSCYRLLSIKLPSSLMEISDRAFAGCDQLYEVYDLTSYIDVEKGGDGNGYVGYYAKEILYDINDALPRYEEDGFYFIICDGVYYLHHYTGSARILSIPEIKDATSITILKSSLYGADASGIIIPLNVTKFEANDDNKNNIGVIYYMGTSADWSQINRAGYSIYNTINYYEKCVHEPYRWTYVNGAPSTIYCTLEWSLTTEPTCYSSGLKTGVCECEGCDYYETSKVSKVDHKLVNGKCVYCNKEYITITPENIEKYKDSITITIDGFQMDEKGASTTQGAELGKTATIIITAKEEVALKYACGALGSNTYLTLYRQYDYGYNSTIRTLYNGQAIESSITLDAGESLIFECAITTSSSGEAYAYVKYIQAFLELIA